MVWASSAAFDDVVRSRADPVHGHAHQRGTVTTGSDLRITRQRLMIPLGFRFAGVAQRLTARLSLEQEVLKQCATVSATLS